MLTILLTLAASKISLCDQLPKVPYSTRLDMYYVACYFIALAATLLCAAGSADLIPHADNVYGGGEQGAHQEDQHGGAAPGTGPPHDRLLRPARPKGKILEDRQSGAQTAINHFGDSLTTGVEGLEEELTPLLNEKSLVWVLVAMWFLFNVWHLGSAWLMKRRAAATLKEGAPVSFFRGSGGVLGVAGGHPARARAAAIMSLRAAGMRSSV